MTTNNEIFRLTVIQKFVDERGLVDYEKLKKDTWLKEQVSRLEKADLSKLDYKARLAFYLNAYNILTLKSVLIELEKNPEWRGNLSYLSKIKFFYLRKFTLAGQKINLYNLENKILRKNFKDPRIHFAINCASKSCPVLPNRLFDPNTIEEYLEVLTRNFVNNTEQVFFDREKDVLYLNPIFRWYKKDFGIRGGVIRFIFDYLSKNVSILGNVKIKYNNYDWELNKQF